MWPPPLLLTQLQKRYLDSVSLRWRRKKISQVEKHNYVYFPSVYQIWCKNVDWRPNYSQKSKFKMAAVRHLGILISPYRTTHVVFSLGYISLSNFVLIRYTVLKILGFQFFAELAWNAYLRPKISVFWGVWTPKNNWSSSRPPKGTSAPETTYYER